MRVPEEFAERRVDANEPAVRVRDPDTYRRVLKGFREALLGRVGLGLDALALADVAGDREHADDLPGVVAVRRDLQLVDDPLPFFFLRYDDHRDLHSFPTRRSSD